MGFTFKVPYVSVWDGGTEAESTAEVNIQTGEVSNITICPNTDHLEICEEQYVIMNGEKVYVYEDEKGFDYWADIASEYQ